jgi:DNA-directed RNA polymerase alpha subunit
MNKAEARIVLGLVKEIELKLARVRIMAESSVGGSKPRILQMDAKEFFSATQEPFTTNRVLKWLDQDEIKTVGQVTELSGSDLARYRNFGRITVRYIEKCLARHGLHLKDVEDPEDLGLVTPGWGERT